MKSRLQAWSKHCRLIACASAFYSQLVWLWVKTCHKWVKKLFLSLFFKLFLPTVSFLSLRNMPYTCSKCLSSNGGKNIFPLLTALNASHVCDFWKEGWNHFRVRVCFVVVCCCLKSVWNCCQLIEINCLFQNCQWIYSFSLYFSVQWHLTWHLTTCG